MGFLVLITRAKYILFLLLLGIFFIVSPRGWSDIQSVDYQEGLVSIQATNTPLQQILEAIAQTGKIKFHQYGPIPGTASIDLVEAPLNRALRQLVPNHSIIYRKNSKGRSLPREFAILKSGIPQKLTPDISRLYSYGNNKNQFGRRVRTEIERQGPESFALGQDGTILACDTVNSRIMICPKKGRTTWFPLPEAPVDIAINKDRIYVLGLTGTLFKLSLDGKILESFRVSSSLLGKRKILGCDQHGPLLLTLDNETFRLDKTRAFRETVTGISALKIGANRAEILLPGKNGFKLELALPGLLSIQVLGTDKKNNIILRVEEISPNGKGVNLRAIKISPQGQVLASIDNIPNNYANWTTRLLAISPDGDLGQLLPTKDGVTANWWKWENQRKSQ